MKKEIKYCGYCGKQIGISAKYCKYCGKETSKTSSMRLNLDIENGEVKRKRKEMLTAAILFFILVCMIAIWGWIWYGNHTERRAVAVSDEVDGKAFSQEKSNDSEEIVTKDSPTEYICVASTEYDADGTEQVRTEYTYNDAGQVISIHTYYADGDENEIFLEYEYYENEVVKTKRYYSAEGVTDREIFYDENGDFIKEVHYGYYDSGTLSGMYELNENGKETKSEEYTVDGRIEWEGEYEYDAAGRLVSCSDVSYGENMESYSGKRIFVYDENGNVVVIERNWDYDGETGTSYTEYEYDDSGNMILEKTTTQDSSGESYSTQSSYEYDSDGTMIGWAGDIPEHSIEEEGGKIIFYEDGTVDINPAEGYEFVLIDEFGQLFSFVKKAYLRHHDENLDSEDVFDDAGNVIKTCWYDPDGELLFWYEYEYQAVNRD